MLFDRIRKKLSKKPQNKYDFSTVEAINSIPIPQYERFHGLESPINNIEYILQRKATEFKKSGRMDLAIACLEKSNEIMPHSNFSWQKKDYMRLVEYLKYDKQFNRAREVEADLKERFPKLFLGEQLESEQLKQVRGDLIYFIGSSICPLCSIYSHRTYSRSGKDKRYPSFSVFPDNLKTVNCPECGCFISFGTSSDFDYKGSLQEQIKRSNRPFIDMRTDEQKAYYETEKNEKLQQEKDKQDYDWICEHLPEVAPKSLSGYRRMKSAQSKNYIKIVGEAQEMGYSI